MVAIVSLDLADWYAASLKDETIVSWGFVALLMVSPSKR
jgi:hypothetical protein